MIVITSADEGIRSLRPGYDRPREILNEVLIPNRAVGKLHQLDLKRRGEEVEGQGQPVDATGEAQDKVIIVPSNDNIRGSHTAYHANRIQAALKFYYRVLTGPWSKEIRVVTLSAEQPVGTQPAIERVIAQSAPKHVGSATGNNPIHHVRAGNLVIVVCSR